MTINNFMNMGANSNIHEGDAIWLFKHMLGAQNLF
jgi:hypothetical protein